MNVWRTVGMGVGWAITLAGVGFGAAFLPGRDGDALAVHFVQPLTIWHIVGGIVTGILVSLLGLGVVGQVGLRTAER